MSCTNCGHGPPYIHMVGIDENDDKCEFDTCVKCKEKKLGDGRKCFVGFEVVS